MVSGGSASLLVTPEAQLPVSTVLALTKAHGLDANSTHVMTQAVYEPTLRGAFGQSPSSMQKVVSVVHGRATFFHSVDLLTHLASSLAPGGTLVLHDAAGDAASADACSRNALLAGLLDATTSTGPSGTTVTAKKPTWEMGAKFSLRKKPAATTATNTTTTAWKLAMEEDGAELIDEEELLDDADMAAPAAAAADDCEVGAGGRKACKNCTCGRAEGALVEKVELTADMLDNPQEGGCGSCALGDAYRCASCPYLGLPAFKQGEKIQLDMSQSDV